MLISTEADLIVSAIQGNTPSQSPVAIARQGIVGTPPPQLPPRVIMAPTDTARPTAATPRTPRPTSTLRPTATLAATDLPRPTATPQPTITPIAATIAPNIVVSPATGCGNLNGKIIEDTITSHVLRQKLGMQVYLPPCYAPASQRYPTLYLIQGRFYVWGEWEDDGVVEAADALIASKTVAPFIMVMPFNDIEMGNASKYIYSSNGADSWEDFIVHDLVPYIDKTYATAPNRDLRAIGGISRGGYWATVIGFSHPNLFSSIGGHSPAISADFFDLPDDFSVANFAPSPAQLRTQRVWLDVGNDDLPSYPGPHDLSEKLNTMSVSVRFSIGIGAHSDLYWASRMKEYLQFYAEKWPKK